VWRCAQGERGDEQGAQDDQHADGVGVADRTVEPDAGDGVGRVAEPPGEKAVAQRDRHDEHDPGPEAGQERSDEVASQRDEEGSGGREVDQCALGFRDRTIGTGRPRRRQQLPARQRGQRAEEDRVEPAQGDSLPAHRRGEQNQREREQQETPLGGEVAAAREGQHDDAGRRGSRRERGPHRSAG
jgi:hypothetical protein